MLSRSSCASPFIQDNRCHAVCFRSEIVDRRYLSGLLSPCREFGRICTWRYNLIVVLKLLEVRTKRQRCSILECFYMLGISVKVEDRRNLEFDSSMVRDQDG